MYSKFLAASAVSLALFAASCGSDSQSEMVAEPLLESLAPSAGSNAEAEFISTKGEKMGNVTVTDSLNGALLRVDIAGLTPGWHAIHLHQVGDCSDGKNGFKASKGHINPDKNEHGLLNVAGYERADIPNIYAGQDGRATAAFFNSYVRLNPSEEAFATVGGGAILMDKDGFAMIIHANADDHLTQPIGGAGARVACAAFTPEE